MEMMDDVERVEGGEEMQDVVAVIPTTQGEIEKEMDKAVQMVRPELNIEKHADFIFAPAHSKNLHKPRSRTWTENLPNGQKVKASLLIEPFRGKTPTTKTRKVYLALQQILEEKGWGTDEKTFFSLSEINRILGLKWHGGRKHSSTKEMYDELLQARWSPMFWEHSFEDENGKRVTIKDSFSILDHVKVVEKRDREKNQLFLSLSTFRFNEEIRKNIKANKTKPTNLIALQINGEIASVLYARFDVIMADKTHYERTTAGVFQDLRLEGKDYHKKSVRKRILKKATDELEGLPLSTGTISFAYEMTASGKDWKLVANKKAKSGGKTPPHIPQIVTDANPKENIPYLAEDIGSTIGQAVKNHNFYMRLCQFYTADILYQSLSEWKADGGREANNPVGYYMAILHRIAHQNGKLWLGKNCHEPCKYRNPNARQ